MQTKNELLAEALNLPPTERAELIEELLSSFDSSERERIDDLWSEECERRIDAYDRSELPATPLQSVFDKINAWKK
ncbi:MAG: hypothetical protein A2075_05690 [Geobacteraceae bacterium GWC2_58_44]|nr:MAG: hypothetical protein A2075_05690 [Geobacteraceae bacterium GWC2_58_44]HBG07388.1 addiction module protein [Geobacter sp.]